MIAVERRAFLQGATVLAAILTRPALGQGVPGNSQYGVKALFFDMFGTVLIGVQVLRDPRDHPQTARVFT